MKISPDAQWVLMVIAMILVIVGFMSAMESRLHARLDTFEKNINKGFDAFEKNIDKSFDAFEKKMDNQFSMIDKSLDKIDERRKEKPKN